MILTEIGSRSEDSIHHAPVVLNPEQSQAIWISIPIILRIRWSSLFIVSVQAEMTIYSVRPWLYIPKLAKFSTHKPRKIFVNFTLNIKHMNKYETFFILKW